MVEHTYRIWIKHLQDWKQVAFYSILYCDRIRLVETEPVNDLPLYKTARSGEHKKGGRCFLPQLKRGGTRAAGIMDKRSLREKPTFQHIRQQAKTREGQPITRQDIATLSGLTIGEVYAIEVGGYSSVEKVQAVLRVFNALTGQRLTMNAIRHAGAVL